MMNYQDKSIKTEKSGFALPFVFALVGFLFAFTTLCGQTLENRSMRIDISATGTIKSIYDISGKHDYKLESDFFTIVTDRDIFSNKNARVLQMKRGEGWIAYYYQLSPSRTVKLEYTLSPEAAYIGAVVDCFRRKRAPDPVEY